MTAVLSDDACWAFFVPAAGTPVQGFWQIGGVAGNAVPDLTPMTIPGSPSYDRFVWSFIAA